jgi:hypothetical protein
VRRGNLSNKLAENGTFISTDTIQCGNKIKHTYDFVLAKFEEQVNEIGHVGSTA